MDILVKWSYLATDVITVPEAGFINLECLVFPPLPSVPNLKIYINFWSTCLLTIIKIN